jgi:hypothetical protein
MATRLEALIASKPTLMIGLSGQEANIQGLFAQTQTTFHGSGRVNARALSSPLEKLVSIISCFLENVYRAVCDGPEHDANDASATFPAYGKPLLLGLLLHVLTTKLSALLEVSLSAIFVDNERAKLNEGLVALRNKLAAAAEADRLRFIRFFVEKLGRSMHLLLAGQVPTLRTRYRGS